MPEKVKKKKNFKGPNDELPSERVCYVKNFIFSQNLALKVWRMMYKIKDSNFYIEQNRLYYNSVTKLLRTPD